MAAMGLLPTSVLAVLLLTFVNVTIGVTNETNTDEDRNHTEVHSTLAIMIHNDSENQTYTELTTLYDILIKNSTKEDLKMRPDSRITDDSDTISQPKKNGTNTTLYNNANMIGTQKIFGHSTLPTIIHNDSENQTHMGQTTLYDMSTKNSIKEDNSYAISQLKKNANMIKTQKFRNSTLPINIHHGIENQTYVELTTLYDILIKNNTKEDLKMRPDSRITDDSTTISQPKKNGTNTTLYNNANMIGTQKIFGHSTLPTIIHNDSENQTHIEQTTLYDMSTINSTKEYNSYAISQLKKNGTNTTLYNNANMIKTQKFRNSTLPINIHHDIENQTYVELSTLYDMLIKNSTKEDLKMSPDSRINDDDSYTISQPKKNGPNTTLYDNANVIGTQRKFDNSTLRIMIHNDFENQTYMDQTTLYDTAIINSTKEEFQITPDLTVDNDNYAISQPKKNGTNTTLYKNENMIETQRKFGNSTLPIKIHNDPENQSYMDQTTLYDTSIIDSTEEDFEIRPDLNVDDSYAIHQPKKNANMMAAQKIFGQDPACKPFLFKHPNQTTITHPRNIGTRKYPNSVDCYSIIKGEEGTVVKLSFVGYFHIESHHRCIYDYLMIRDGPSNDSERLYTICGYYPPRHIIFSSRYAWLHFHSDFIGDFEGFRIDVAFIKKPNGTSTSNVLRGPHPDYNQHMNNDGLYPAPDIESSIVVPKMLKNDTKNDTSLAMPKMRKFPFPSYSQLKSGFKSPNWEQNRKRRGLVEKENCEPFKFRHPDQTQITHPKDNSTAINYSNRAYCTSLIYGPEGTVVELTFIDVFHLEEHPGCVYDYLEIRDGEMGYSKRIAKVCGDLFPSQVVTTGPYAWLKFVSDDTIEYEGFRISIAFRQDPKSRKIPRDCFIQIDGLMYGHIGTDTIKDSCKEESKGQALDVLWTIVTPENTNIYLNFTSYHLEKPNECEENLVQVFGAQPEDSSSLAYYCGLVANSVTTKGDESGKIKDSGNVMHVRFFASMTAIEKSFFNATFTAFRTLDPSKDEKCDEDEEFDCEDNTCIAISLKCDRYAHCRLKADEDPDLCKGKTESMISQPHIMVILIIFSLILSGMSFVFVFKCIRKLYQDHKLIKDHIQQSCEERIDSLVGSRLTLDAKRLQRESQRISLEIENHTNEMYKRQRSLSKQKRRSVESGYIPEVPIDVDGQWRPELNIVNIVTENVLIEHNAGQRRSDISKKEESLRRSLMDIVEYKNGPEQEAYIISLDTKESSCQTRESLFQTEPLPSPEGILPIPAFSTFGYPGGAPQTSEIKINLDGGDKQKKIAERPASSETTRSAPDVIIVSKPVR